jgi:hypothetical protein
MAEFPAQALEDGVTASKTSLLGHQKRKETTVWRSHKKYPDN